MKTNPLLKNTSLLTFLDTLPIDKKRKKILTDKIPQMDEKQRLGLLKMLSEIYMLENEKNQTLTSLANLKS